jgi:hypothetical protein
LPLCGSRGWLIVKNLIDIENSGVIEFQQNRGISFKPEFALAGSYDGAAKALPNIPIVTRAFCIFNGAHVPADFLPVAAARRIDRAHLPVDNRKCRPLARKALAASTARVAEIPRLPIEML